MKRFAVIAMLIGVVFLAAPPAMSAPKGEKPPRGGGGSKGGGPKDTNYKQPLFFEWEKGTLDVLIVPPEHGQLVNGNGALNGGDVGELDPCSNSYLTAIEGSINDWRRAANAFGSADLKSTLVTKDYVVGCEPVPDEALREPEIVIVTDESKAVVLGVAISFRAGEPRIEDAPCLVDNSKLFVTSFTQEDMYNVNGQEYGHCLGLDHTEGGPKGDKTLEDDIMFATYEQEPGAAGNHRQCMSNLNVKGLELVFGEGSETATMAPAEYQRINC